MRIKIENYRGWNISFDTEAESFFAQSDEYDMRQSKKSFASAKKYVDDFIKENVHFEPVWVERLGSAHKSSGRVKLIGLRKDRRFIYEDSVGNKQQMSEFEERNYIICNEANESIKPAIADCYARIYEIENEIKSLDAKLIKVGLQSLKAKYII